MQNNKKTLVVHTVFIFMLLGAVEALYGFGQLYGLIPNKNMYYTITGHFENPDHFAGYIGSFAPLSLGVYLFRTELGNKIVSRFGLVTFVIIVAILPATTIRGAWLGVLAGICYLFYNKYTASNYYMSVLNTWFRKLLVTVIVLGICFIGGVALYNFKPNSAFGRLLIWKTTMVVIAEKPLVGHGFEQFKIEYNIAQSEYFASGKASEKEKMIAGNVEHAHNEYLQIWAELGLVGLLLFIGLIVSVFYSYGNRKNNYEKSVHISGYQQAILLSVKASLITILTLALFSFPLHILPTLTVFFFLLALVSMLLNDQPITVLRSSSLKVKVGGLILLIILTFLGRLSIKRYKIHQRWEKIKYFVSIQEYEKAIVDFEVLYSELDHDGLYLFQYGGVLTAKKQYNKAIPILERAKSFYSNPNLYMVLGEAYENIGQYDKALANYKYSWNIVPHKIYPLYRMAKVHQKTGNIKMLIVLAEQIIAMNEKIPTTAGRQIKNEMNDIIEKEK